MRVMSSALIIQDQAEGRIHGALSKTKELKNCQCLSCISVQLEVWCVQSHGYGHSGFSGFINSLYVFFIVHCHGTIPKTLLAKNLLDHVPFSTRSVFPNKPLQRLSWQARESLSSHKLST